MSGGLPCGPPCLPPVAPLYPTRNADFAGRRDSFVNDTSLQLALREIRAVFTSPFSLGAMAGLVILLTLGGPFRTATSLNDWQRLLYWGVSVPLSYGTARALVPIIGAMLGTRIANRWVRMTVLALALSVPVGFVVLAIETIAFGWPDAALAIRVFVNSTAITLVATLLLAWFSQHFRAVSEIEASSAQTSVLAVGHGASIMEKVPLAKRGRLIALTVNDHYVDVVTDKGTSLVLIRLGDAMRLTGGVEGVQIHRSHWVARDAVTRSFREGDRLMVELSDGRVLPVSRSFAPAAREAGLI